MTFKRLLSYLKPYKNNIKLVIFIVAISSICTIFIPKLTGDIISSMYESITSSSSLNTKHIYTLIIIITSFYLITALSSYLENYIMSNISEKAVYSLKNEAYEKLSKLEMKYYDIHKSGEIMSKINNDIETISSLFIQTIPRIISYLITFIGTLIIMLTINVKLTLIAIIAIPFTLIFSKLLMKFARKSYKQYHSKRGFLNSLMQESYINQETISLYNNDTNISMSFKTLNKDLAKTSMKASIITSIVTPISSIINYSVYFIIIILSSKYVLEKKLLLGDIQALIQYTKQLSSPISNFSSLLTSIQSSLAAADRVFSLLDEKEENNTGNCFINTIDSIEFKNVEFSYDNNSLITDFNLKINKGEKIAIIGETGSGKSTIINLLMRFYKIKNGDILINNKSIYDYSINSYYSNISLVPQNNYLFNDSIKNNLKFANFNITDEKLLEICKRTNSFNILSNLPQKENEIIKEEEQKLSEGEKQLLVISRALIKEHNLLILDEATSNIDSKNEKDIQESLDTLTKDKTTIIIAHKLSTILKADKIIVMKNGKIIETGTHSSLYKEKGEYYSYLQSL